MFVFDLIIKSGGEDIGHHFSKTDRLVHCKDPGYLL